MRLSFRDAIASAPLTACLGSGLIDRQSQNMTVAAMATADRKTFGHLS